MQGDIAYDLIEFISETFNVIKFLKIDEDLFDTKMKGGNVKPEEEIVEKKDKKDKKEKKNK